MQLTNPLVIFLGIWTITYALFSLHLSALLLDEPALSLSVFLLITIPFASGYLLVSALNSRLRRDRRPQLSARACFSAEMGHRHRSLRGKLVILSAVWAVISVIEIIVSRGLPIIWLFTGSNQTYQDFGIHSLHGFSNSLLLACSLISVALYFYTRRRSYLIMPGVAAFWAIVVVSRNLLLVNLVQCFILWLRFYAKNIGRIAVRALIFGVAVLYVFGVVGDMRTGARKFLTLAQPTVSIPTWVPSGFFWAYMYVTTPMNNVLFDVDNVKPLDTGELPHTFALLLPSVIRKEIISTDLNTSSNLVTQAFNVSSAFVGPYLDEGLPGVAVYSLLIGIVCTIFWYKRSFVGCLGYCVFAQSLFFSNFYNQFLYLPVIFQLFWFYIYKVRFKESRW